MDEERAFFQQGGRADAGMIPKAFYKNSSLHLGPTLVNLLEYEYGVFIDDVEHRAHIWKIGRGHYPLPTQITHVLSGIEWSSFTIPARYFSLAMMNESSAILVFLQHIAGVL